MYRLRQLCTILLYSIVFWTHFVQGQPNAESRRPTQKCVVKARGSNKDDAPDILRAFHRCNYGGTVVLNDNYTIASALDLTFLHNIGLAIEGTLNFSDNITYWTANSFKYSYQNVSSFWRFGGRNVKIYGNGRGLLNGNGQAWYDAFASDSLLRRPVLLLFDGLHGGSVTGLKMQNPPSYFNFVANSSDVLISDFVMEAKSTSSNVAKNTDGWDTYRSDSIVIRDSLINNGDDCVSFKPNSTNILVSSLNCNGSHGISVGSLGQYIGELDIVENIYVYNITMSNASDGARIKVWPGSFTPFQPSLSGGGGTGYVRNVTYDTLHNFDNDWAIELTQCYGSTNLTLCDQYPSNVTISDILFKNFDGHTSSKNEPAVGTIVCSAADKCSNIQAREIDVQAPSGQVNEFVCTNVDDSLLDVSCTDQSS